MTGFVAQHLLAEIVGVVPFLILSVDGLLPVMSLQLFPRTFGRERRSRREGANHSQTGRAQEPQICDLPNFLLFTCSTAGCLRGLPAGASDDGTRRGERSNAPQVTLTRFSQVIGGVVMFVFVTSGRVGVELSSASVTSHQAITPDASELITHGVVLLPDAVRHVARECVDE